MEVIVFEPRPESAAFDVADLRAKLQERPECAPDPHDPDTLLVVGGEPARSWVLRKRAEDPKSSRACGVIIVREKMVALDHGWADPTAREVMRQFARWLFQTYDPRIFSEVEGDEWTDRCGGDVDALFA